LFSKHADRSISTPPTTVKSSLCSTGYEEFDGACYRLYDSPSSFEDAAENCARKYDLVQIVIV